MKTEYLKKEGLYPLGSSYSVIRPPKKYRIQNTGIKRNPKKGEWYLSGAIIKGWKAPNDLSTPFYIGKLVEVEYQTIVKSVKEVERVQLTRNRGL